MNKTTAKQAIINYLKIHGVHYHLLNEKEGLVSTDKIDTVLFSIPLDEVFGRSLETTIRFRDERMYCMTYPAQPTVESEDEEQEMRCTRILNYINGELHFESDLLYDHKMVLLSDTGDVYNGFHVRYEVFEENFDNTMACIMDIPPQLFAHVYPAIFFYVKGEIEFDKAVEIVTEEI